MFILTIALSISFYSCEKEAASSSKNADTKSNGMKDDCSTCHVSGGSGTEGGIFTVGGTVWNLALTAVNPNGVVKLYSAANGGGNLVATIEVDGVGNFYTNDKIDFTAGLYPSVTGTSGTTEYMNSTTTTGSCNSCHTGASRITIN